MSKSLDSALNLSWMEFLSLQLWPIILPLFLRRCALLM